MAAVWLAARSQMRRRRGTTVALVLLVGLAGGVVIAAVAGASRTATAMDRFVAYSRPEDVYVDVNGPVQQLQQQFPEAGGPQDLPPDVTAALKEHTLADRAGVARLPEVAEFGRAFYVFAAPSPDGSGIGTINPFAPADSHAFRTLDRPKLLRGRLARVDRADEAIVDDLTASLKHLRVGSRVTIWTYTADQTLQVTGGGGSPEGFEAPKGPAHTFRIVGIVRSADTVDAPPASAVSTAFYKGVGGMVLTPAFTREYATELGGDVEDLPGIEGFRVRLRHGLSDLPAFRADVARYDVTAGDIHIGSDITGAAQKSKRAIRYEAIALAAVAGLSAVASLVLIGPALGRHVAGDLEDGATLASLGFDRRRLTLVPMARAVVIALAGAAAAVFVAIALSPLSPIGLARRAEIHPGLSVNVAVLGLGFLAVGGAVLLVAVVQAWRAAGRLEATYSQPARPGFFARSAMTRLGGPTATTALGMSAERRRGRSAQGALVANALGVAGVVAALTFAVSLHHLVTTPSQQGWTWDVVVGNPNNAEALTDDPRGAQIHDQMVAALTHDPDLAAIAGFASGDATIDGEAVPIVGFERERGDLGPRVVVGRAAANADEVNVGRDVLGKLHRRIGDMVTVGAQGHEARMRVVGVVLQPTAGDLSTRLSCCAVVTLDGFRAVGLQTPVVQFAVRYRASAAAAAVTHRLVNAFPGAVLRPYAGGEVGDLAQVSFLPWVLAGLVGALGIGSLGVGLIGSVRSHRRDLAVLKTLGFVRGQVSATVSWQATIVAGVAVALGVPCGVALGRWTWRLVASSVGSVSPPDVPVLAVLLVIPATLIVANLLGAGPAWNAGRVQPARVLKAE